MKASAFFSFFLVAALFVVAENYDVANADGINFMPVCNTGDGALSGWLPNRDDALIIAREHQQQNNGHNVEVVQQGAVLKKAGTEACYKVMPTRRDDVVRIANECDTCRSFSVERISENSEKEEITLSFEPGKRRFFKTNGGKVTITNEGDCE